MFHELVEHPVELADDAWALAWARGFVEKHGPFNNLSLASFASLRGWALGLQGKYSSPSGQVEWLKQAGVPMTIVRPLHLR